MRAASSIGIVKRDSGRGHFNECDFALCRLNNDSHNPMFSGKRELVFMRSERSRDGEQVNVTSVAFVTGIVNRLHVVIPRAD